MKRLILLVAILATAWGVNAQQTITIKGNVRFPNNTFMRGNTLFDTTFVMSITQRDGFNTRTIEAKEINPDGTYEFKMRVDQPGSYTLNCSFWEAVDFWAEDENLTVNFRGRDTAKMIIKNPPYVHLYGGPKNDLINLVNFDNYRNYQLMIGVSQAAYRAPIADEAIKQQFSGSLYDLCSKDMWARINHWAEVYADRNSVLALLPMVSDPAVIEKVEHQFETKNPNYTPFIAYKKTKAEKLLAEQRNALGMPAPDFSFPTPDAKKTLGPTDFKGKLLIIDFWASWCGPCRQEVPNLKKVYAEFKNQGLEILGVSIDKNETDWKKAMKEEAMPWPQVQAPGAGKSVMEDYLFSGIPYIILLNQEGQIIGKMLRGPEIGAAVKKALETGGKVPAVNPQQGISMRATGF